MPIPKRLLQFRMLDEQLSGGITLEYLNDSGNEMLRGTAYQQMDMVRHTLHSVDDNTQVSSRSHQLLLKRIFDISFENLSSVLDAPYDMILESVYISMTIFKSVISLGIHAYYFNVIIPYVTPENELYAA